jgi:hypothetical protein
MKRNSYNILPSQKLNVDGSVPSLSRIMKGQVYYDTFKDFYRPPSNLKNRGMGATYLQTSVPAIKINISNKQ